MNILFLCNSNITRSQIAEGFLNKYSKKHREESAALIKSQDKMHPLVIKAMKGKGIDISKNKSKKLTKDMIDKADLIILMSSDLRKHLDTNKRIEIWNIPDVVARETDNHLYPEFVKTRDMIENKVKGLLKRIDKGIYSAL